MSTLGALCYLYDGEKQVLSAMVVEITSAPYLITLAVVNHRSGRIRTVKVFDSASVETELNKLWNDLKTP